MQRLLLFVALMVAATFTISAQKPWVELDSRQQQRLLSHPDINNIIKETISHLESITECEREELWSEVVSGRPKRQFAPLYLYIYEVIRSKNGSQADDDVLMVSRYPEYFLKMWSLEGHCYDVYNYAYIIGLQRASKDGRGSANALLHRLQRRRYKRKYGDVVAVLRAGSDMVERSKNVGNCFISDVTPCESLSVPLREVDERKYHNVVKEIDPVILPAYSEDNVPMMIRSECIMWQGCYNSVIEQSLLGREASLIHQHSYSGDDLVLVDANGDSITLPPRLYVLPEGLVFALDIDRDNNLNYLIVCRVTDGVIEGSGILNLEPDTFVDAKCVDDGLYLHLANRYLFVDSDVLCQ